MSARPFFDTNVLIYAFAQDDARSRVAESLLSAGGTLSVQILNEFAAVAVGKLGMPWRDVLEALAAIRSLCRPPLALTLAIHEAALNIAGEYRYRIYDSLVIATALEAGCTTLYSEDLQDGQRIGKLAIANPFRA